MYVYSTFEQNHYQLMHCWTVERSDIEHYQVLYEKVWLILSSILHFIRRFIYYSNVRWMSWSITHDLRVGSCFVRLLYWAYMLEAAVSYHNLIFVSYSMLMVWLLYSYSLTTFEIKVHLLFIVKIWVPKNFYSTIITYSLS